MADKRLPKGISQHYGKLRISFQYCGSRCRETLDLSPTTENIRTAVKMRDEIIAKIKVGVFNYYDYFPDSKSAEKYGPKPHSRDVTFGQVAQRWLAGHDHIVKSTRTGYKNVLNRYWMPRLARMPIRAITGAVLKEVIASYTWRNAKTRNNAFSPVRMIFEEAFYDGIIDTNPAARVRSSKTQNKPPDPLTLAEVNLLLDHMAEQLPPEIHAYFEVAIFTGLRTSEQLAVLWSDIDWVAKTIKIDKAKVMKEVKGTKTCQVRDVELNSRALSALKRLRQLYPDNEGEVFIDPITGSPFVDDKPPRLQWYAALDAVGLRRRVPYQCRHTFATLNLTAGANPMWLARQLGHTTMKMLLSTYSRWIDGVDARKELSRLETYMSGQSSGQAGDKEESEE